MLTLLRNQVINHLLELESTNTKKLLPLKELITKQVLISQWQLIYRLKSRLLQEVQSCQDLDSTKQTKLQEKN